MKIRKYTIQPLICSGCGNLTSAKRGRLNAIELDSEEMPICDECLQELNRKIVEYLAEKNL